jgi:hypothetical protein
VPAGKREITEKQSLGTSPPNSRSLAEYNKDYVADITRERCGQKLILPASGSSA